MYHLSQGEMELYNQDIIFTVFKFLFFKYAVYLCENKIITRSDRKK